jgi:hypothetical protein
MFARSAPWRVGRRIERGKLGHFGGKPGYAAKMRFIGNPAATDAATSYTGTRVFRITGVVCGSASKTAPDKARAEIEASRR